MSMFSNNKKNERIQGLLQRLKSTALSNIDRSKNSSTDHSAILQKYSELRTQPPRTPVRQKNAIPLGNPRQILEDPTHISKKHSKALDDHASHSKRHTYYSAIIHNTPQSTQHCSAILHIAPDHTHDCFAILISWHLCHGPYLVGIAHRKDESVPFDLTCGHIQMNVVSQLDCRTIRAAYETIFNDNLGVLGHTHIR